MRHISWKNFEISILPALAVLFACGIVFEHVFNLNFLVCAALSALSLIFAFIFLNSPIKSASFLLAAFFFLGSSALANRNNLSANHIKNILGKNSTPAQITGTIFSPPSAKKNKVRFLLSLDSICLNTVKLKASGKILVEADSEFAASFNYADVISLIGKIYRPFNFDSQNNFRSRSFDYRSYLARQDIYFMFSPDKGYPINILGRDRMFLLPKIINRISDKLNSLLFANLPEVSATFYSAFLLGRREAIYQDLNDIFIKTGTAHILAISGMNVAIIALIFVWFFKAIGLKNRLRLIFCLLGLIFYCILTGMNPPVLRSTLMAVFIIVGLLLEREGNIYNSLSLAALLMLIFQPRYIFDIGFQLSFVAVLGIVYLTPCFIECLTAVGNKSLPGVFKNRVLHYLLRSFIFTAAVSLAAWVSVEPLIVYYFKIITPVALLANIVVVPFLTFIQVSGATLLIVAIICPFISQIVAYTSGIQTAILVNIIYLLSRIPGAYFYVNFDIKLFWLLIYYAALVYWAIWLDNRRRLAALVS